MSGRIIKVCIDKYLPSHKFIAAAEKAKVENPLNAPVYRDMPLFGVAPMDPLRIAILTGKRWENERTLQVSFMGGHPQVQAKVEEKVHIWSNYANIKFNFGDNPQAEIRVAFDMNGGSWSYIGTDALSIPINEQTVNFGWLEPSTPDDEYSRVVVHEFGHTLGCIHEHSSPTAGIPWNKQAVYDYLMGPPNNWPKEQIDLNLFEKYNRTITQYSEFDPKSIMIYPIPKEFTTDGSEYGMNNKELSDTDKKFIGLMYPFDTKPVMDLKIGDPAAKASIGEHGEEDLYKFVVLSESSYTVETEGPTDVVMALFGPDDLTKFIAEDDNSGKAYNAKITTQLKPGTYHIRIRHYFSFGTGDYGISVRAGN
jgi:hypothetical protein